MSTINLIAACAVFYWARGLFAYQNCPFQATLVPARMLGGLHELEEAGLRGFRRDGVCKPPSYWGTRNRSICIRHLARTQGSALPVLNTPSATKLPVARHDGRTQLGVYQPTDFWYSSMRADDKHPTVRTKQCQPINIQITTRSAHHDTARKSTFDNYPLRKLNSPQSLKITL